MFFGQVSPKAKTAEAAGRRGVTQIYYSNQNGAGTGGFSLALGFLLLEVELGYPTLTNPYGLP